MDLRTRDIGIALGWFALDQATKLWTVASLDRSVVVVPGLFRLSRSDNAGALFGIMADWPDAARLLLLTLLPLLAIAVIVAILLRTPEQNGIARIGLALILGGALGNVTDRVVRGFVIDFIDLHWSHEPISGFLIRTFGTNRWPTFNVADTGLTCGATLLLADLFRRRSADGSTRASLPD